MRVLVVDDEPVARRRLVRMLGAMADVVVAGQAADGVEALEAIEGLRPDLVLLDIRMPGLDGLTLASSGRDLPAIVFTTAYDEYAVQAFEVEAIDYLLKPVKRERLAAAVERARAWLASAEGRDPLRQVLERLAQRTEPHPITARSGATVRVFDPRSITRLHAASKYVVFHVEGAEYVLDESLVALEERLAELGFLRVHRGELVNVGHVTSLRVEDGSTWLELSDGQHAPVSRRHLPELKQRLGIRARPEEP